MTERAHIVDRYDEGYTIELFESEPFFALRVYRCGVQIGYARCLLEDGQVTLDDIRINGRLESSKLLLALLQPFRRFMARNYQSRGIGSKLIKEVIAYSREIGAVSIHGSLVGKKELLERWFSRHGFEVDPSAGRVLLRLAAEPVAPSSERSAHPPGTITADLPLKGE